MFAVINLRLLRATTIAIYHRTNIMGAFTIFVQKPFQYMHSMATMSTSLADNDGILESI